MRSGQAEPPFSALPARRSALRRADLNGVLNALDTRHAGSKLRCALTLGFASRKSAQLNDTL
jgi:hypothetical protein